MNKKLSLLLTLFGLGLVSTLPSSSSSPKVYPELVELLSTKSHANIVVSFSVSTNSVIQRASSMHFKTRGRKITFMKAELEKLQMETQGNAIEVLSKYPVNFTSLWISNKLYVTKATMEVVQALADLPEVSEIREEVVAYIDAPQQSPPTKLNSSEWGIQQIQAEEAWALPGGNNGSGVVLATIDSGVYPHHEALRDNKRKTYYWYDPNNRSPEPFDTHGHGTHTTGTAVGRKGIGVAPGAEWIHCAACEDVGSGVMCNEPKLAECGQWILCPTLWNGTEPNCDMAPQVVSNSYASYRYNEFFHPIIDAWEAANIIPVFALGNSGPDCYTGMSPGDYANVIGVGATDIHDNIAKFSARGPAAIGGYTKPNIVAPGYEIGSASNLGDDLYTVWSGTSMSTPHVAGVVALILSEDSSLTFGYVMSKLLYNTDQDSLGYEETCVGPPGNRFPNNIYGYGRVNAMKALNATIATSKTH